jgi:excisionase family DNA binding protein
MPTKIEKLLYSRREAAAALGCCLLTIDHLVQRGKLSPVRVGIRVMFSSQELLRFAGVIQ